MFNEWYNRWAIQRYNNLKNTNRIQELEYSSPATRIKIFRQRQIEKLGLDFFKKNISEENKKYYEDNPEALEQMSERMKKYYENPDARRKLSRQQQHKQFDVFTKDGMFIKTFTYQFEAREYLQKEYNITSTIKISEVLTGSRNSSAGFVFRYK